MPGRDSQATRTAAECGGSEQNRKGLMLKKEFTDFIFATNTDGSGKAASYVRALDMLGPILTKHYPHPIVSGSMWHGFTLSELKAIHEWLCAEARKGSANAKALGFESPSYLANNFYNDVAQKLHFSAGIGLHVIMNQNFNINFEFGKCLDPNDGTGLGINIGLNYIF